MLTSLTSSPTTSRFRDRWINGAARRRRIEGLDQAGDELVEVLDDLGDAENYERWIISVMHDYLGTKVVEVGAGSGNLTRRLAEGRVVTAVEPHPALYSSLCDRFDADASIDTFNGTLLELGASDRFDSATMVNVLEHIDDDVEALRQMRAAVRPGGHVAVFSPAFEPLYSDFDCRVGHVRRYTRATIAERFRAADLDIVENRYMNLPGFFGWLLIARILRQNPTDPKRVETYDRHIVPLVRRIEERVRVPFGQSVMTIGRRVDDSAGTKEQP